MSTMKNSSGKYLKREFLLLIFVIALIAVATAATIYVVLDPIISQKSKAVSTSLASSGSLASSFSSSSSMSSLSSIAVGSYDYFVDAVFIGDSLTSGIAEYSIAKNAGIFASNGMSTSTALTKKITVGGKNLLIAEALKDIKPAKVYILLGSNDINWMNEDTFITNYGKLIDNLKSGTPNAVYYIQSIFPVTAEYEKSTSITNEKINSFNARLLKLSADKDVKYVDVCKALTGNDGKMIPAASSDGFNIKKAYYKTWFDYLTMNE